MHQTREELVDEILHTRAIAEENITLAAAEAVQHRMSHITPVEEQAEEFPAQTFAPSSQNDRSKNPLRPETLDEIIGQDEARQMMRQVISAADSRGDTLDHCLLIGPAGTGKTTFANVIANELGRDCYQVAAPVSYETLMELKDVLRDGDVLFVDEIHMQAVAERRGSEAMSAPEVFLSLLEDSVIASPQGMIPFPNVTIIGATTDPGRLPDPFLDRFPLQPRLRLYTAEELEQIAEFSAQRLDLGMAPGVARRFAEAARGTPRIVGNYVRNAAALVDASRYLDEQAADQVLITLNGVTAEGLTPEMQGALKYLFQRCRRERADGEVLYQASVNNIATAIGLSRDVKAVQLRVEPFLIQQGYLQVGSGGRLLTDAGIQRAKELLDD